MKKFAVLAGTQGDGDVVCRIFDSEPEAQAYAATAREWHARRHDPISTGMWVDSRWPRGSSRYYLERDSTHRADLVDEAKAASVEWPFGDDKWSEFFRIEEVPYGPYE